MGEAVSALVACLVVVTFGGLIGLAIGYVVLHSEVGARPANRLFGYIAVCWLLTLAALMGVAIGFHGSTRSHILEAGIFVSTALLWASCGWFLAGRLAGGRALVTLPRLPRQWFALGGALLIVLPSLGQWGNNGSQSLVLAYIGQVSLVAFCLLLALIRPQIRERGVVMLGAFLPWRLLQSYAWEGERGQTLTLRRRRLITGFLLSYPRLSLRVPVELHEEVDALLRQHLQCTEPLRAAEEKGTGAAIGGSQGHRGAEPAEGGAPSPLGRVPVPR